MSDGHLRYPLATGHPPPWACAWGVDKFGTWAGCGVGDVVQKMRWIPPGTFLMGSPESEAGRFPREVQHRVLLSEGYWLADTPCTQALWKAVMGDSPSKFRSPKRPVEQVSWEQATEFVRRLEMEVSLTEEDPGTAFCLPTEAQWEYACRAGTKTATYAGDLTLRGENDAPELDAIAWYGGNSGEGFGLDNGHDSSGWPEKQYAHTQVGSHPVGEKRPNAWGLYDMLGNVWEWCSDWYAYASATAVKNPTGPAQSPYRVMRGGSWFFGARGVRAAHRDFGEPGLRGDNVGFRFARCHLRLSRSDKGRQ